MSELRALSFGRAAEHYERGRPVWPVAAIDAAGVAPDAHVLDLAAGTGKLTRVLVERFRRVTAVEPDDAMRALNRWGEVRSGSAQSIPLDDAEVDAVFVAEAFHWFADPPALAEIARVLRPAGTLVLMWTRGDGDWSPAVPGLDALWERLRESTPQGPGRERFFSGEWRGVFADAPFESLQETSVAVTHEVDRRGLLSYLLSQSSIAARPPADIDAISSELEGLVPPGRYELPLHLDVFTTRRL